MLFLWYVILCMVYMVSGYICKCKEKDSHHIYGCSHTVCNRIKYWHFIFNHAFNYERKYSFFDIIVKVGFGLIQGTTRKKIEYFRFLVTV